MRVVVNQQVALGVRTGIGHYTAELLRCLREQAGAEQIDAFPDGWVKRARELSGRFRTRLEPRNGSGTPAARSGWKHRALECLRHLDQEMAARHLRLTCSRRRYDLYHEPNVIPLPCDVPTVATLHDLSVLLHPEWHPADRVAYFEKEFHRGLGRCVHFLAVSEFCRKEMIHTLNVPPARVTCIYNGVRPGLGELPAADVTGVLKRLGLPTGYLLHVGTIEPRKNLLRLMQAYCTLPEAIRARGPLLLVGRWGWGSSEVADYFESEARHRGVLHLGYVTDELLPAIYNGARALVFPTHYEGFGLPPVEMMACGGAVLASTAGAVREVVGGHAHLIAPEDDDGWRMAMRRVLTDDDWWRSLRQGVVAAARRFTWDHCAADTLRVYRALTEPTSSRRVA